MILQHSNNSRFTYARKLVAIPLVILIFCSLAMQTKKTGTAENALDKSVADTTGPAVFLKPEVEASFPGGAKAWQQYLLKTLHYPQAAQDLEIQGAVVVQFIVEKDGSLRDVKAISGPEKGGLKEEAVRVLQNSGKWVPGKGDGQIAVTSKRQPIVFRLERQ